MPLLAGARVRGQEKALRWALRARRSTESLPEIAVTGAPQGSLAAPAPLPPGGGGLPPDPGSIENTLPLREPCLEGDLEQEP
jgi:hypothetical protein